MTVNFKKLYVIIYKET